MFALILVLAAGTFSNAQAPSPATPNSSTIIHFLSQTIDRYRRTATEQQMANELTGVMVVNNDRQLSDRIVLLAFDFARAQADSLGKQTGAGTLSQDLVRGATTTPSAARRVSCENRWIELSQSHSHAVEIRQWCSHARNSLPIRSACEWESPRRMSTCFCSRSPVCCRSRSLPARKARTKKT